jgi:hypothetical protein
MANKDKRIGELVKLRNEIQMLEWRLMRLRTGRKCIQDTAHSQDRTMERIMELRKRGQRLAASF